MNNNNCKPTIQEGNIFRLIPMREYCDERGTLGVAEMNCPTLPFAVKRVFWIYGIPQGMTRGGHAHHTCDEVLIPLCGSLTAHLDNGTDAADIRLSRPGEGLYIPRMTWCSFANFSADCICLCLASEAYNAEGYINRYDDFINEIKGCNHP